MFISGNILDRRKIRFKSLKETYTKLTEAINKGKNDSIVVDATIQRFEFTFELMWKVLKDYIEYLGFNDLPQGPKSILQFAFKNGIIENEEAYSNMLVDRNSTTHIYDEKMATHIFENIKKYHVKYIKKVIDYLEKEKYLSSFS